MKIIPVKGWNTVYRSPLLSGHLWMLVFVQVILLTQSVWAIEPFSTDGCSMFPDGTITQKSLWRSCCIEHDKAYWQGGTFFERVKADKRLRDCVTEAGAPFVAEIMLGGVRIGGSPFWPTPYRWGYGWPGLRGYKPVSANERAQIKRRLEELEQNELLHQ